VAARQPRVVVVRGHQATPWELRPWELLSGRFDVAYLRTPGNRYDVDQAELEPLAAKTLSDRLPKGRLGTLVAGVVGDRYLDVDDRLRGADIVHAEELGYWFASDVARRKDRLGYKLVQTVWETIPMLSAYRNRVARRNRREVLDATDLFLPATERARDALLLEGVPEDKVRVCAPGIDLERFGSRAPAPAPEQHVLVSPGRLVWEKGHQDAIRALAAIRRGLVDAGDAGREASLLIVGAGPEESRLRAHAAELGVAAAVEIRSVPYDDMPGVFGSASAMVLASLPSAGCMLHPLDIPHCFWEEQFGMVLAEAMAASLAIVASRSGAIPEVCGESATYFEPGDWMALAHALAAGPLARAPGERVEHPAELVERYSAAAAAARLGEAYGVVLGQAPASVSKLPT
jgi:glycosyltransferase involved in cell wall biosynthesis